MPRIIGSEKNELLINDPLSGGELGLYYRMPTTKERQGYLDAAVKRVKNRVTLHHAEARMKYGMSILVGIREGDFMRIGTGGIPCKMSSDPESPAYYEKWREEMETGCGDLIMALATLVFDGGADVAQPEGEDIAGE